MSSIIDIGSTEGQDGKKQEQQQQQQQLVQPLQLMPVGTIVSEYDDEEEESEMEDAVDDNASNKKKKKVKIPSAKKIRQATLQGIRIGILPEYQDYCVVLQYLVDQFLKYDFNFAMVQENVPWLNEWLVNPFNEKLLNEELQIAANMEASRIYKHVQFMLKGGCCSRSCGRCWSCICCCIPGCSVCCKVCCYFVDLSIICAWNFTCDWWLGAFMRKYVLIYICVLPKYIKLKMEDILIGDALFDDEELSIHNIYDSNSYRIANQYACILLLAIVFTLFGTCLVIVTYVYLPSHSDHLFVRIEAVLGVILVASGFCGLQFYCRCML